MADARPDVLMLGRMMPMIVDQLDKAFTLHKLWEAKDPEALIKQLAPKVRGFAAGGAHSLVGPDFMSRFPRLEIISNFGVGYDAIDARWAGEHGITVTNTPDVLTEEVADTTIGLLLCTVRQLPQSDRYLRQGKWLEKNFPLTASLRDRKVGILGLGRIGLAVARRLDAMQVPVAYHTRSPRQGLTYRHYPKLVDMARDVDILIVITPGGPATRNLVNMEVLKALGPNGILINVARGSVVDEPALIKALQEKVILSAGLDVFVDEPRVPKELIDMEHVVLFPHVGSASVYTRDAMGQLVVDNLLAWKAGKPPITPVAETPWPPKKKRA